MDRPENDLPRRERDFNPEERRDWETIQVNETDTTQRLMILGGWLYRTASSNGSVAMVFVPGHERG
jgi:hypothetical protein